MLATVIVVGFVLPLLGVPDGRFASLLTLVPVLAIPVLELQLVGTHTRLHPRALPLAIVGFVVSASALILLDPLPSILALPVIAYFFWASAYAAFALVREARAAAGPARVRVRFGAAGAFLLGLMLLSALLGAFSAAAADIASRLLALASALAFVGAFSPPDALERMWREPWIRRLLTRGRGVVSQPNLADAVADLESAVAETMGARAAVILLPDEFEVSKSPRAADDRLVALARAALSATETGGLEEHGGTLLAAPMGVEGERVGAVALRFARRPMFMDATEQMLQLVAVQAAVLLKAARAIEELRLRNDALEAATRTASEATRAKSEFLANMSHELRTPLNSILGFSDLLESQLGTSLSERHGKFLRNIHDSGEHLLQIVNDVLDIAKVEARRLDLHRENVDLDSLLAPVVQTTTAAAQKRGLSFDVARTENLVVNLDPLRFRQVLLNLLSNAVKFTPPPGAVRLEATMDGNALRIQVSDTGVGIPADKVGRAFGTFERLHEGNYATEGTGLGLALTKHLVELHGGTIEFVTAEGKGTTFTVLLPAALASPPDERVLIVEDESRDAQLIVALANREGLPTEVVATIEGALRAIRRRTPIAAVVDLRLPDGRGEALLAELENTPDGRRVPTIVVSVEDDEGQSRLKGADDHLTKPIDHERLARWLRQIAARAKLGSGAPAAR